jgi:gliding motility-associated-like protein
MFKRPANTYKLLKKYLGLTILGLLFVAQSSAQIVINRFANNLTYFPGAGISVNVIPQGIFSLSSNQFILELSDVNGSFTSPVLLATITDYYVSTINASIPAGTAAGTGYKIRVRSTSPVHIAESSPFSIAAAPSGVTFTPPAMTATNATQDMINCVANEGYFGYLKRDINNTTISVSCQVTGIVAGFTYTIRFIDRFSNPATTSVSTINNLNGGFSTPSGRPIGHYPIEITKTHTASNTSSVYTTVYLFHTGNTGLGSLSSDFVCSADTVFFIVNQLTGNYPGSKYRINYGDGTAEQWKTHAQLTANDTLFNIFQNATCSSPAGIFNNNRFSYKVQFDLFNRGLLNDCVNFNINGNGVTKWVNVSIAPAANFNAPAAVCSTAAITCTNTSTPGQYGTSNICLSSYNSQWQVQPPGFSDFVPADASWSSGNNMIIPAATVQQFGPGCWRIRLSVSNATTEGCTRISSTEKTVRVESPFTADFNILANSLSVTSICFGQSVTLQDLSNAIGTCKNASFIWSITPNTPSTLFTYINGTNNLSQNPQVTFNTPGSYNITQNVSNACGLMTPRTRTLLVLGNPTATFSPTSQSICQNDPVGVNIDFLLVPYRPTYSSSPFLPSSYSWTVGGNGVTAADYEFVNNTTSSDAFPTIRLKAFKVFAITVTVNGSCGNSASAGTITITVKRNPLVTNTDLTQTLCSGASFSTINFTADMASPSFSWTAAAVPAGTATGFSNGNGNSLTGSQLISNSNDPVQVVYAVSATVNGCTGPPTNFTINLNPAPRVVFSSPSSPQRICSEQTSAAVTLTTPTTGASVSWTSTTPAGITGALTAGTTTISAQTLINANNTPTTIDYVAIATAGGGSTCPGVPATYKIIVNPKPVGTATPANATICSGTGTAIALGANTPSSGNAFSWTVTAPAGITNAANGSTPVGQTSPSINQTLQNNTAGPLSVTYTITPTHVAGSPLLTCTGNTFSTTITVNPRPTVSNTPLSQSICSGATTSAVQLTAAVPGTTFTWTSTATASISGNTATGTTTIPAETLTNTGNTNGTVTYAIVPTANGCTGTTANYVTTIFPVSSVTNAVLSQNICSGANSTAVTFASNVSGTTYTWTSQSATGITGATASGSGNLPLQTLTNSTQQAGTVTYTVIPSNNSCPGIPSSYQITVQPAVTTQLSIPSQTICSGSPSAPVTLSSSGPSVTYSWTSSAPAGISGATASGSGNLPSQTLTNTTGGALTVTYNIRATTAGSPACQGPITPHYIVVNPSPTVSFSRANETICSGGTSSAVTLTPTPSSATIAWNATIPAEITGATTSGTTSIPAQTLINSGTTPRVVSYAAIATTAGDASCPGITANYTITVNPLPDLIASAVTTTICSGAATSIALSSSVSGTTYAWTVTAPAEVSGAQNGTGNNISQTLVNTSTENKVVTYTITSSYSFNGRTCSGTTTTVEITVKPRVLVSNSPLTQAICSGTPTTEVALTSNISGASFSWTGTATSGISTFINSGTGNIPAQTITNTANTNGTVTYIVTPEANGCQGIASNYVITVYPRSRVTNTTLTQSICSGTASTAVTLSANVTGTTFSWTASSTSGTTGFTASGTGNIPTQTITNSGSTAGTVSYTIIPSNNNCPGDPTTYTITVQPRPTVTFSAGNQVICSGTASQAVTLSSSTSNVNFSWTSAAVTGITGNTAAGTNTIPSQTLTNSTANPLNVVYVAKATTQAGSCEGPTTSYTITVNPSPTIQFSNGNQVISSGSTSLPVTLTSTTTGAQLSWTANPPSTITGATLSGTTTIPAQTLVSTSTSAAQVVYAATITTGGATACPGTPANYTITVNPIPNVSATPNPEIICSGGTTSVTLSSSIPGTTYAWTVSTSGSVTGASAGNGNSIRQTLTNTSASTQTVTYIVTPSFSNGGIVTTGSPLNVIVNVRPIPALSSATSGLAICSGTTFNYTATSLTANTNFSWTRPSVTGISAAAASGTTATISETLTNTTTSPITVTYSFTLNFEGCARTQSVSVVVNPNAKAEFSAAALTTCPPYALQQQLSLTPHANANSQPDFKWYANNVLIGNGATIPTYSITQPGVSAVIKLVAKSRYNCLNDSMSLTVSTILRPAPSFTKSIDTACGPVAVLFTNTSTPTTLSGSSYSWNFGNGQTATVQQPAAVNYVANQNNIDTTYYITLRVITQCETVQFNDSILIRPKPKALFIPDTTVRCSPATIRFINNSKGRAFQYIWNWDDGSIDTVADNRTMNHYYATGIARTYNVKLIARNECGVDSFTVPILVRAATIIPGLIIGGPNTYGCSPKPVTFVNNSVGTGLFTINFNDGSPLYTSTRANDTITHIFNQAGTYTVTLRGQNDCTDTSTSKIIIVHQSPRANFTLDKTQYCSSDTIRTTNLSTGAMTYIWNFGDGSANIFNVTNPIYNYASAGTYTITLIANSSFGSGATCSDTMRKVANVTANTRANFTSNINNVNCAPFTFFGYTTPTDYINVRWFFMDNAGTILGNATGNNATYLFANAGLYKVRMVSTNPNGCIDSMMVSFRVTASPVVSFTATDTTLCSSGGNVRFTNTTTFAGTENLTYQWSIDGVNASASDTTFNYNFAPTAGATVPITYRVTLTATPVASGCLRSYERIVTVLPEPRVTLPANLNICTGTTVSTSFSTVNSGGVTTYAWTNNRPQIGLAASGTGNLPSFTATNTGFSPVTATITVIPSYTKNSKTCVGQPSSFTIKVNPVGHVNQPENQVVCHGQLTLVNYTTNNTGGTTTYSWTNDNPTIGIVTNNTGNIATFYAINDGASPTVATIVVTPTFTSDGVSCVGPSKTFTITVLPKASVDQPANQVVCNGQSTSFTFGSSNTGGDISYRWTNDNATIGLAANGIGPASFTATNTGTAPVTATITVIPTYTYQGKSCDGPAKQFTITVNPSGQVNNTASQILCNGSLALGVRFSTLNTIGTTTYNWTNSAPSIGLAAFGTGEIDSFRVINNGIAPVVATIRVTPSFAHAGLSCPGPSKTYTYTVNPSGHINQPENKQFCDGVTTTPIGFTTNNTGGTVAYTWTNNNTAIGLGASGTGTIAPFRATNTTSAPILGTIAVTPLFTNAGVTCSGPPKSFTITVLPLPQTRFIVTPDSACAPMVVTFSNLTLYADTYQWFVNNIPFSTAQTPAPQILTQAGTNYTFTLLASNAAGGCGPVSYSYTVKTLPTPQASFFVNASVADTLYACKEMTASINNSSYLNAPGTTAPLLYSWYLNGVLQPTTARNPVFALRNTSFTRDSLIQIKLIVSSLAGCIDSVKKWVRLYPEPRASFIINGGTSNCAIQYTGLIKTITNNSQIKQPARYEWSIYNRTSASFSHGVRISSTTAASPQFIFPDNTSASDTTYDIKLTATSPDGCTKDTIITQIVFARPIVNFRMTDSSSCTGSLSVSFLDLSQGPTSQITSRKWWFDDGAAFSTLPAVNHIYSHYGAYYPSLFVTNARGCISDTMKKRVVVFGAPTANFTAQNTVCARTPLTLINTSVLGWGSSAFNNITWDFGDGNTSNLLQPTHTYQAPGTYLITLSIRSDSSCVTSTKTKTIIVFGKPRADFDYSASCVNTPINFYNRSTVGYGEMDYNVSSWSFGDGQQSQLINPVHTYSQIGSYTVQLIVSGNNCPHLLDTITKTLTIKNPRPDSTYPRIFASRLQRFSMSSMPGGISYLWTPPTGLTHPNRRTTDAYYLQADPTKVNYTITIKDSSGCLNNDRQEVWVFEKPDVYAPTAFTPNGDGANDDFKPFYINIKTLTSFRIYNRWGVQVFETNDMNRAWNGVINGSLAPLETYTWIVECYDVNDKKITRKGMVSLLKY